MEEWRSPIWAAEMGRWIWSFRLVVGTSTFLLTFLKEKTKISNEPTFHRHNISKFELTRSYSYSIIVSSLISTSRLYYDDLIDINWNLLHITDRNWRKRFLLPDICQRDQNLLLGNWEPVKVSVSAMQNRIF